MNSFYVNDKVSVEDFYPFHGTIVEKHDEHHYFVRSDKSLVNYLVRTEHITKVS